MSDYRAIKSEKKLILRAISKNGRLLGLNGEPLPELRDGAQVDIRVHAGDIVASDIRHAMQKERAITLLEPKQTLYMALNTMLSESHMISESDRMDGVVSRELLDRLNFHDVEYLKHVNHDLFKRQGFDYPAGLLNCDGFVEIELIEPLRLLMKGDEPQQLLSCECHAPYLNQDGYHYNNSLNHACTQISENFELGRLSHTVNVFKKVFYKDGWVLRPLEYLRQNSTAIIDGLD